MKPKERRNKEKEMSCEKSPNQFTGAVKYVLDDELKEIVNITMA
jgi:hypothetical protein